MSRNPRPPFALLALLFLLSAAVSGCKSSEPKWVKEPLVEVQGKTKSSSFSIALPEGFRAPGKRTLWRGGTGDWAPEVVVADQVFGFPKTLDEALANGGSACQRGGDVVSKETIDGGFVVACKAGDKTVVTANVWKKQGAVELKCYASKSDPDGVGHAGAIVKRLEEICRSLRILGPS